MLPLTAQNLDEFYDPELNPGRIKSVFRRISFVAPQKLRLWIMQERLNLGLWTPIAIALGAGVYFGLAHEPRWLFSAGLLSFSAVLTSLFWSRGEISRFFSLGFLFFALGFAAADYRTARAAAPTLKKELGISAIQGELLSVEHRINARRYILELHAVGGLSSEQMPAKAQITWRGDSFEARPGDIVSVRAALRPPPPPASPGAYNFARHLYFENIGAVGYAVSPPLVRKADSPKRLNLARQIETIRAGLLARILNAAPGEGGAIVGAVVTGKRDAITPSMEAALRDAGLAHLLAISGLHMGLATGLIFFLTRLSFAAFPNLALRYPIKKWAAGAALLSGFIYLILSGAGWSARRAFIMTAIIFVAILVDRRALSLRNVAIAATLILLTTPEALLHPGFQMSFAAVTALIAGYEWMSSRAHPDINFSMPAKIRRYVVGLGVTDVIAATATAPFALFHFNRVALYSLPANLLAMPLMGFWIMPAAIAALILAPVGFDGWAWRLSASGVDIVLAIAREVTSWRGAVSHTWQWPLAALLIISFGGLWLCLARSPLRLIGLLAIPLTALIVARASPPQIFVAASGRNAAALLAADQDTLLVYSARRDRFSLSVWEEAAGLLDDAGWPAKKTQRISMRDAGLCDQKGCVISFGAYTASFLSDPSALTEDCARATLVIAFFPVRADAWRGCGATLIDAISTRRRGAHAIWFHENGKMRIKTVLGETGTRPWSPYKRE